MLRWMWLCFAIGCGFEQGVAVTGDAGTTTGDSLQSNDDAMPPDAGDPQLCWSIGSLGLNVCFDEPPSGNVMVPSNTSIDTESRGTGPLQCKMLRAGSSDVCAIAASSITIDATRTLSAEGDRPLVLIAQSITVSGTIDVASHRDGQQGPASDLAGCNAGTGANDSGGGQGGSFGGKGGDGGNQGGQNNSRGRAGNALTVTTLRGGCPGGAGGGDKAGDGGHGGGAVALLASSITLATTARINASGESGGGADAGREGGGGAGSGGMIVLSAPQILVGAGAQLFALGGGGGGASSNNTAGDDGGEPAGAATGGTGGNGGDAAGDGGAGYSAAMRDGKAGPGSDGGGGGGGGAGVIRVFSSSPVAGAQVSPPPT